MQDSVHSIEVHSAGIVAHPEKPFPTTLSTLLSYGIDAHYHHQTRLTKQVLDAHDVVIAMAQNHVDFIRQNFQREVPLFNEVTIGEKTSVLDVDDVTEDWTKYIEVTKQHIIRTVTYIYDHTPLVYHYLKNQCQRPKRKIPRVHRQPARV